MNFECTLLPAEIAPVELSQTKTPLLRKEDIDVCMDNARENLQALLTERPEITRSLCNTIYMITLADMNEPSMISKIIVVESHG